MQTLQTSSSIIPEQYTDMLEKKSVQYIPYVPHEDEIEIILAQSTEKFTNPIKNFYVTIPQNYLPGYKVNLFIGDSIIATTSFFTKIEKGKSTANTAPNVYTSDFEGSDSLYRVDFFKNNVIIHAEKLDHDKIKLTGGDTSIFVS